MKIAQVQFASWDKIYDFDLGKHNLKIDDHVIVKTDLGRELGKIVAIKEINDAKYNKKDLISILRKANTSDIEKVESKDRCKAKTLCVCRELIKKYKLPAKLIDVRYSFDGGRMIFAFVAPQRIDFRSLVKDLTGIFQKSIRLQQVGVREEAKMIGGIGPCGREQCCLKFLKNLGNINTDFIFNQQLSHRGSERLSGPCGRLLCCLAYEEKMYEELKSRMPKIGDIIKLEKGKGRVVGHNILRQSVRVEMEDGNYFDVPLKKD